MEGVDQINNDSVSCAVENSGQAGMVREMFYVYKFCNNFKCVGHSYSLGCSVHGWNAGPQVVGVFLVDR